jgi:drug/metabolite transporter (DMT)-like permease
LLLQAMVRWTRWFGPRGPALDAELQRALWWRGGLNLAAYIVAFNSALRYTGAAHVALYLGASPVWALLWEGLPSRTWSSLRRYGAALLALTGVVVLFWPSLGTSSGRWQGEALGLVASVLWTNYGRQCRVLGARLSGAEVSAQTMWRAGVLLLPLAALEFWHGASLVLRTDLVLVQLYCILAGGVAAFAIWTHALRRWPASQVLLFNNLIPISTMAWAKVCLNESPTPTFWVAMLLIIAGVVIGQTKLERFVGLPE